MAQNYYEGMFLVDSGKFANDSDGVMTHVRELLSKTGASIREDRVWMDGKLAYPIDGRRRGVHFLVYFQGDGNANTEIARQVRLSDLVLRHIVIRHPEIMWDRLVAAISGGTEETTTTEETTKTTTAPAEAETAEVETAEAETAEEETAEEADETDAAEDAGDETAAAEETGDDASDESGAEGDAETDGGEAEKAETSETA